jgi:hypothetical protein
MKSKDIKRCWDDIRKLSSNISGREMAFNMRRRYNPHHPKEDVDYETVQLRTEQLRDWNELKSTYISIRNEIAIYLDSPDLHSEYHEKSIELMKTLEKVLDKEAEEAFETMILDTETI